MRAFSILRNFSKPKKTEQLIQRFLEKPEHFWILKDRLLARRMISFLTLFPLEDLYEILENRKLVLLYCNRIMSCSISPTGSREIILVFPELRQLLLSVQNQRGFAILAHELAHILLEHTRNAISPVMAQIEADAYAKFLGFRDELIAVLEDEGESEEIRVRIKALSA